MSTLHMKHVASPRLRNRLYSNDVELQAKSLACCFELMSGGVNRVETNAPTDESSVDTLSHRQFKYTQPDDFKAKTQEVSA